MLLFFASRGIPPLLEGVIGAGILVAAVSIWRVDRHTIRLLRTWLRAHRRVAGAIPVLVYVLVSAATLLYASRHSNTVDWLREHGGWVTMVALSAAVVWILAGALRLLSLGTSLPRFLAGVGPILLGAFVLLMSEGLIPWLSSPGSVPRWAAIALVGGFLFLTLVGHRERAKRGWHWRRWRRLARQADILGFAGALVSAALFAGSIGRALLEENSAGKSISDATRKPEKPKDIRFAELPGDEQLARDFAPILMLHKQELWPLSSVEDTLAANPDAKLSQRESNSPLVVDDLKTDCGDPLAPPTPCYTISCPRCDREAPVGTGSGTRGTVYARVFRRTRRSDAAAFIPPHPFGSKRPIVAIVEYWLFYPYDRWESSTAVGKLVQEHQGDWESVTVGFGEDPNPKRAAKIKPFFVAYSAHCGGRWYPWESIRARTADLQPRKKGPPPTGALHPLVAVAKGSHANYRDTAERRASDWGSCEHIPSDTTSLLSYTWNVRDLTSADYELTPERVVVVGNDSKATGFAGNWGGPKTDTTVLHYLLGPGEHQLAQGTGPMSPALKDFWTRPSWIIFRTNEWKRGG